MVPPATQIRIVDPVREGWWDSLVASHPAGNIFQSSAWAKVLIETYGHKPIYLQFSQSEDASAMIPFMEISSPLTGRRGVSMPFSDMSQPLLSGGFDSRGLLARLSALGRERAWNYFEVRGGSALSEGARPVSTYSGHNLDLTSNLSELFGNVESSVRRAIRKAEASGLSVRVERSREAILQFYALHVRTRRRHGVPPQSKAFFLSIHKHIIEPGLGFVVLAEREARIIAGAVFFHFGSRGLYKFGASDERLQQHRPNNLVMWEGIKHLVQAGAGRLHFGRTSPENEGLRRFKCGWGAREESIEYFRFNTVHQEWTKGAASVPGLANAIFRRLPLSANRLIGTVLYPHMD